MSTGGQEYQEYAVRPLRWGEIARLVAVLAVSAGIDVLLIMAGLDGALPLVLLLALHFCLAPLVWVATRNGNPTLSTLAIISVLAMGPVGALGMLVIVASQAFNRKSSEASLAKWHEKLAKPVKFDLAERLAEAIGEDRMIEPGAIRPVSFQDVSRFGSVSQRQTALGIVSQRFDPSFSSILKQELVSEEPAVRVSAAAVFTKLRDKNRLRMGAGKPLSNMLAPEEARERGLALARGVQSGLLDPSELMAARKQSLELLLVARHKPSVADELEEVISTFLFEEGHLQELQDRLGVLDLRNSSILRSLYARLLLKEGRMTEAAEVIRLRQGNSIRLNFARRPEVDQALLSPANGDRS